ncbi:MAG TPA: hypothetical protein VIL08_03650 [Limnochorda sp.]
MYHVRRLFFALVAVTLAFSLRAPAALAVSPELSFDYWMSRLAREDRAGSQITRTSRASSEILAQLDLNLTSRLGVGAEMAATLDEISSAFHELTDGSGVSPSVGYRVEAAYRLPILGAGVGPTYVHAVLPQEGRPPVEVSGLGGLVQGGLDLSDRIQLEGSFRYLPKVEVREDGQARQASYTQFQVGASLNLWRGLEVQAGYRQEETEIPNPEVGLQERAYQQSGYTLGLAYRF